MTYTWAKLEISPAAYDEIAAKLEAAGYKQALSEKGMMDMAGIGLTRGAYIIRHEGSIDLVEHDCPRCGRLVIRRHVTEASDPLCDDCIKEERE